MHPRSTNRPAQAQLVFPLLDTLAELNAPAKPTDVADALADRFSLNDEMREETVQCRRGVDAAQTVNVWNRHVRYARERAKERGLVCSVGYGKWALTDAGRAAVHSATPGIAVSVVLDAAGRPLAVRAETIVARSTAHTLACADSRDLSWLPDECVQLVVTSPPYWDLKVYDDSEGQLARPASYDAFLNDLDRVWAECYRVLQPGGRVACNVGDVLRSRARHGRHHILPLHADIMLRGQRVGFDILTS